MRSIVEVFYKKSLDDENGENTFSLKISVDESALCNDTFIEKEIARRLRPGTEILGVVYPIAEIH